jgi:hypothetical protein
MSGYVGFHGEQITSDQLRYFLENGQQFVYTCAVGLATATNPSLTVCGLSVFNPANSGKSILLFGIQPFVGGSSPNNQLRLTTVDPAGTTGFTGTGMAASNAKAGALGVSVASLSSSPNGIAASPATPGSFLRVFGLASNAMVEILSNGACYLLPPGNGLAALIFVPTAAQLFGCTMAAVEF